MYNISSFTHTNLYTHAYRIGRLLSFAAQHHTIRQKEEIRPRGQCIGVSFVSHTFRRRGEQEIMQGKDKNVEGKAYETRAVRFSPAVISFLIFEI